MNSNRRLRWWGRLAWVLAIYVLGSALRGVPLSAEEPIEVIVNEYALTFGQELRFHLQVVGKAPIQSILLTYRTSDDPGIVVTPLTFDPSDAVDVDHVHRIAERYIQPFVRVTFWWTIVDAGEAEVTTEPTTFVYADDRFDWQTLSDGVINVHWYEGELAVAQKALNMGSMAMARARQEIPVDVLHQPIDIYLYSRWEDARSALALDESWQTEALTLYETGVILAWVRPEAANLPELQRILPHEVTHTLLHEATQTEFDHMPLWLAEGLATMVEHAFAPDPDVGPLLQEAVRRGELGSLDQLCAAFPPDPDRARVAYAASASVVSYIRDMYGRERLRDLVAAYGDGATCEGGVRRVLGLSLNQLYARWCRSIAPGSTWTGFWRDNGPWLILVAALGTIPATLWITSRTKRRAREAHSR
jgi:hypothetical protein